MLRRVLHWYGKESNLPRVFLLLFQQKTALDACIAQLNAIGSK